MGRRRWKEEDAADLRGKRQQILEAAYVVFSRKGYHRTTVDEIIALADTGKGTVYNYFVNKEQLFYTLIKERSLPFEAALNEAAAAELAPRDKIKMMIRVFLEFYVKHGDLWRVLMHEVRGFSHEGEVRAFHGEQLEKYRESFRNTIGQLEAVIRQGVKQELLRPCDANHAAYALFSVIIVSVFQNLVDGDIEKAADDISDIFLHGIAK